MQNELDLRPYILALVRGWYWLLLGGLILAVGSVLWVNSIDDEYAAKATVVIVRERTDINFDQSIESESEVLGSRDVRARQEALQALTKAGDIADAAVAAVRAQFPEQTFTRASLVRAVSAQRTGELIEFTASYGDPEVASALADAWAEAYVTAVNRLYGTSSVFSLELVGEQIENAAAEYDVRQEALEAFAGEHEILFLESELLAQREQLAALLRSRSRLQVGYAYLESLPGDVALTGFYADLGKIELWRADAQALRERIAASGGSSAAALGETLAFIALEMDIFSAQTVLIPTEELGSTHTEQTFNLQLDLTAAELEPVTLRDIDNVSAVLHDMETAIADNIDDVRAKSGTAVAAADLQSESPLEQQITATNEYIQELQQELIVQHSRLQELQEERDAAWGAYLALQTKQTELGIESGASGTEVRLASGSYGTTKTSNVFDNVPNLVLVILAIILGMSIPVLLIILRIWWAGVELIEPQNT